MDQRHQINESGVEVSFPVQSTPTDGENGPALVESVYPVSAHPVESDEELARRLQTEWNGDIVASNETIPSMYTSNSSGDASLETSPPPASRGKNGNARYCRCRILVYFFWFGVVGVAVAGIVYIVNGMGSSSSRDDVKPASERLALYESLVDNVMKREAFSPIKDKNWGESFESRLDKYDIRGRFLNATDDTELYRAINMLSCARRDDHLKLETVDDGIEPDFDDDDTMAVPLRFMADYTGNLNGYLNVSSAAFFVSQKGGENSVDDIQVGDWLIEVNDRPLSEHVEFMMANYRMSTIAGGYWRRISDALARYDPLIEQDYYRDDGKVKYLFRRDSAAGDGPGLEYSVTLKYGDEDDIDWKGDNPATEKNLPSYWELISETEDYRLYRPTDNYPYRTLLLEWLDFEDLPGSTKELMEEVEDWDFLDYDVIVDATISSGGSGGPYAIERFAKEPFQSTWGNVRCSDILEDFAEEDLESGDSYEWITDVVLQSCDKGAEYSKNQPFKLRFEELCEDGILDPHDVHFTGNSILLIGPEAGSQLDQFNSMWIDNNIGMSMGMPSGGYSNTWEYEEDVEFPKDGSPAIRFVYSIGHTIRPNGEILEGNPAQPTIPFVLTHDNFQTYFSDLILAAQEVLTSLQQ